MPQYRIPTRRAPTLSTYSGSPRRSSAIKHVSATSALILSALQAIANTPYRIGSYDRDELAPGLRSYHLIYSRQQSKQTHGAVKSPRHIVFYRVVNDDVIEVVRLLHDAMEVQLHLPND